ncbi:MAG: FtsQ-type POTRA domain-containing protein, partial [Bifidobacterium sp.]|nr:FtsQ-type POTRA domain-containing protein [Bifidobacterium sp.]
SDTGHAPRTASGHAGTSTGSHPQVAVSSRTARSASSSQSHANDHRFHLEETSPTADKGGKGAKGRRFAFARKGKGGKRGSKADVKRPRIVEEPQTELSEPGAFVDARQLRSEDIVARTLAQTSGSIGVASRPKVVDFAARQKERRKANARYIARNIGIAAAVIAVVVALGWLLFFSPVLRLEKDRIEIKGANEWVGTQQVMAIAERQAGKSLLTVSDGTIEKELLEIPGVSEAKATKKFPDGIEVSITAQRPAAMLKAKDGGALTAVDSKARILNSVSAKSVEGIPVIEVEDVDKAVSNRAIQTAVTILDGMPEGWRKDVKSVQATTQDSIVTTFANGITVTWGDANDLKLKMAIVDKIMNDPKVIGDKKQINVSAPGRPIIK